MKVIIINGPNLNLLGVREKSIYGNISFEEYFKKLVEEFPNLELKQFQSNLEGVLIDKLQEVGFTYDHILLNAGGYTHTSVSIRDALDIFKKPIIEIHMSNIYKREEFRKKSLISDIVTGGIFGLGDNGYILAIISMQKLLKK